MLLIVLLIFHIIFASPSLHLVAGWSVIRASAALSVSVSACLVSPAQPAPTTVSVLYGWGLPLASVEYSLAHKSLGLIKVTCWR